MLIRRQNEPRPIFFISHSVGGLVVKLALGKASRNPLYESILYDCYGAAFFGKALLPPLL